MFRNHETALQTRATEVVQGHIPPKAAAGDQDTTPFVSIAYGTPVKSLFVVQAVAHLRSSKIQKNFIIS